MKWLAIDADAYVVGAAISGNVLTFLGWDPKGALLWTRQLPPAPHGPDVPDGWLREVDLSFDASGRLVAQCATLFQIESWKNVYYVHAYVFTDYRSSRVQFEKLDMPDDFSGAPARQGAEWVGQSIHRAATWRPGGIPVQLTEDHPTYCLDASDGQSLVENTFEQTIAASPSGRQLTKARALRVRAVGDNPVPLLADSLQVLGNDLGHYAAIVTDAAGSERIVQFDRTATEIATIPPPEGRQSRGWTAFCGMSRRRDVVGTVDRVQFYYEAAAGKSFELSPLVDGPEVQVVRLGLSGAMTGFARYHLRGDFYTTTPALLFPHGFKEELARGPHVILIGIDREGPKWGIVGLVVHLPDGTVRHLPVVPIPHVPGGDVGPHALLDVWELLRDEDRQALFAPAVRDLTNSVEGMTIEHGQRLVFDAIRHLCSAKRR